MRELTEQEQGDLVAHLRYVIQKVERYAESRNDRNVKARLHHSMNMVTATEDAKDFLASIHLPSEPENKWTQMLHLLFPRTRKNRRNSTPSQAPSSSPPETPNLML